MVESINFCSRLEYFRKHSDLAPSVRMISARVVVVVDDDDSNYYYYYDYYYYYYYYYHHHHHHYLLYAYEVC